MVWVPPLSGKRGRQQSYSDIAIQVSLGSRLIEFQCQKMTAAARAMADRNTFGHLS
jgi:hypothetical protein